MVFTSSQPFGLDVAEAVDQVGSRPQIPRNFDQAIGVRTVIRSHYKKQVRVGGYVLHGDLAIFGGIADVLRRAGL